MPTDTPHAPEAAPPTPSAQPAAGDVADGALPANRIAEVRERIRGGAYDAPDAAGEVARRILAGGDV